MRSNSNRRGPRASSAMVLALVAGVVLGGGPSAAAESTSVISTRKAQRPYPTYASEWMHSTCGRGVHGGAGTGPYRLAFPTRASEYAATVSIDTRYLYRYPSMEIIARVNSTWICGTTAAPVDITGGRPLIVELYNGVSDRGPSVLAGGVVNVSFYSRHAR